MPRVLNIKYDDIPDDAIYIGRTSPYGNPHFITPRMTRAMAIAAFERDVLPMLDLYPLEGRDLVCHCAPKPCHGDVLLREANKHEICGLCNDTGWCEAIGPCRDGSYITSRRCPHGCEIK